MKTIRLIVMFFIICMLGACTAEELAGPESGVEDDAPVVIAISPADITSVNMNSRAAGDNSIFSVIDDVNVKVNYGGNTVTVYLVKNGDSFEVSGSVENGSAGVVSSKTADGKVSSSGSESSVPEARETAYTISVFLRKFTQLSGALLRYFLSGTKSEADHDLYQNRNIYNKRKTDSSYRKNETRFLSLP